MSDGQSEENPTPLRSEPSDPTTGARDAQRQRTVDALCEAFANDELRIEEFERRVEAAHRAQSQDELRALLGDLPSAGVPAVPSSRGTSVQAASAVDLPPVPATELRNWSVSVGVLGGSSRRGRWKAARKNVAIGLLGGCSLDFREAMLAPGVTNVHAFALCGGVEIIVPPGVNVETSGVGIMGAFEQAHDAELPTADPTAPVIRVSGVACMGGVDVRVRLPGESARDARQRARDARKRKRLGKGEP